MVIQCIYNESPEMIKMLVRHGNSFALILDKAVLELLNVDPARPVAVSTTDGKSLLVTPLIGAEGRTAKRTRRRQRPRRRAETRKHMIKAISILSIGALAAIIAGCLNTEHSASATGERYPWKRNIVTTVFWIGERPSANNPVPNPTTSWHKHCTSHYLGVYHPKPP